MPYDHTLEERGCVAHTNSWALTYPPRTLCMIMFSVHFLFIGVSVSPMGMHRVMISKDGPSALSLKLTWVGLSCFEYTIIF